MKDRFSKNATAHDHWKKGDQLFDQKNLGAAMEYFGRAIKLDPEFAEAYNSMGLVHYEGKNYALALECYKRAVVLKPDFVEGMINLGTAFLFLERYPDAALAYEKVLERHPDMPEAHNNLGLAYEQMHRTDDALKHYRKFIELWKGIRRYKLATQERVDRLEQGRKSGVNEPIRYIK